MSSKISVADYIVDFLYDLDVRNVFMLSGTGSVQLDDAFARKRGMKYVCARHEATAVVMAEAVAKLKNRVGVAVVTTGPGGTNAIAGVTEAWVDSVPVLVLSGQVNTSQIINDRAFGIQGFDIVNNVKNFTKYAASVTDPKMVQYHLQRAIYEANNGRPGPVWIDIPMDVQAAEVDLSECPEFIPSATPVAPEPGDVNDLSDLLESAQRPLVVFGRGLKISNSQSKLYQFLKSTNIPSISARMANDVFSPTSEYYFGMGGIRGRRSAVRIMKEADLLITMGTSNCYTFFGDNNECINDDCRVAVVNIDENIFTRSDYRVDLPIRADLNQFLSELLLDPKVSTSFDFSSWLKRCNQIRDQHPMVTEDITSDPINSYHLARKLSELTSHRHIFTNDAGSSNYISSQSLNLTNGQRELTSGAFYTMGLTLPLAVGAAVAEPESQIIAITGDGSIELNIQELQTISLNNLNVKIIVINNGGYASIRDSQDAMCGGRYTDDEQILNFEKISEAFGLQFEIIQSVSEIEPIINKVLADDKPTLIEVVCDDKQYMIQPLEEMKEENEQFTTS